jgi:NAD(P)-dependent dehydrogenase (short-subunit alcohol dehydrogenase family)
LQLTRAVLPHVFKAGRGAIVFTAFEASQRDSAAGTANTVATHGIIGLARSLAVMYRERGVRTNAIAPGATRNSVQSDTDPAAHSPEVIDSYLHNAGHPAAAEQQAAAIVFLASDAAGNLNGAILPVDGGWCAA